MSVSYSFWYGMRSKVAAVLTFSFIVSVSTNRATFSSVSGSMSDSLGPVRQLLDDGRDPRLPLRLRPVRQHPGHESPLFLMTPTIQACQ